MEPDAKALAEAHWDYVASVIKTEWETISACNPDINATNIEAHLNIIGHHYRTAFIHGYKHGREDRC